MTTTLRTDDVPQPLVAVPLHGWLPIAEVARHLGMKRARVYQMVIRAHARHQDWVKQEVPSPGGPRRWVINTDSEIFLAHQRRWERMMENQQSLVPAASMRQRELGNPALDWGTPFGREQEQDTTSPFPPLAPFSLSGPLIPPPPPPPPLLPAITHDEARWQRWILVCLAVLQLITLAGILKRLRGRGKKRR
jgi:hypothetical protein